MLLLNICCLLARQAPKKVFYKTDPSLFNKLTGELLQQKNGCLTELISNAKDAITKTNRKGYIDFILTQNSFIVKDNGIGMTKAEAEDVISTLGKSLTSESNDSKLIGKYGLGLYSVFKLGDKAVIRSRKDSMCKNVGDEKDENVNEGGILVNMHNANYFEIDDHEIEEDGTEVEVLLKDGIKLSKSEVEGWVKENIMGNDDLYEIRMVKSEEDLEKEKESIADAYVKKRKEEIVKQKMQELEDANKEDKNEEEKDEEKAKEEKANEDEKTDEEKKAEKKKKADEKKAEEERLKALKESITKEVEESFKLTAEDEENIANLQAETSSYQKLETAHWTDSDDPKVFERIYKERYNKTDLSFAKKVNFTVRQKNLQNQTWDNRFEALIFVPKSKQSMMQEDFEPGRLEIFVSGSKVPITLQLNEFLKPFYIIVRSNEALITSTRESFYDAENTNKNIVNALTRKTAELFLGQADEVVHEYSKVIKRGFMETKRDNNKVHEKLAGILTFETKDGIMTLNKFVNKIESLNKKIEAKKNGDISEEDMAEVADYNTTIDHLYYTNISKALANNIENPLFDGVIVPFIFLNDIHDEEIMNSLKDHHTMTLKNIITKHFHFKEVNDNDHKEILAFIKETLGDYVSNVVVSRRLQKYPFCIVLNENSVPSTFKAFFGDNKFDDNFMREYFDPKPVLEVNVDCEEFSRILETKDKNAIFTLFLATCVACKVDPYNKATAFVDLMNAGRSVLGMEDKLVVKKKGNTDFAAEMMKNMGKGMDGTDEEFGEDADLSNDSEFNDYEDINAEDINAEDMNAEDLKTEDINVEDINAENIDAENNDAENVDVENVDVENVDVEDVDVEDGSENTKADDLKVELNKEDNVEPKLTEESQEFEGGDIQAEDVSEAKVVEDIIREEL